MGSVSKKVPVFWETQSTPASFQAVLNTLGSEFPIAQGKGKGISVAFEKSAKADVYSVTRKGNTAVVRYHTASQAMRCVGALMAGTVPDGETLTEKNRFDTFGIMLDCSRNAVMKVDHFKKWLRRLALLGYNMGMLYTEETYELDGEPYFGYMRGAYTKKELKAIDDYAHRLGIEMIPCIQTLGHLAHLLKWGAYRDVKDTNEVLMTGEEKTYTLIGKMVSHWKSVFRTNRIHIGMDEAWDLGRGAFLTKKGFVPEFDLFNRHLARVKTICEKQGLKPMIWSDMYFTMGSPNRGYYDKECRIPDSVKKKIPRSMQLVYWDYYHEDPAFYLDYIRKHRALGFEPLMASGVWTWSKLWYDRVKTEAAAGACIDACIKAKVREIFFTMWGDNGAYCDFDSALAGLAFVAEKSFAAGSVDQKILAKRFGAICGGNFDAHQRASDISHAPINATHLIWDDPLMQRTLTDVLHEKKVKPEKAMRHFAQVAKDLASHTGDSESGDMQYAALVAQFLAAKVDVDMRLRTAYAKRDLKALAKVKEDIVVIRKVCADLSEMFRAMWLRHNKAFGLDVIQNRFAILNERYREAGRLVKDLIAGKITNIEELDECSKRLG